jgi:hypothetical protein
MSKKSIIKKLLISFTIIGLATIGLSSTVLAREQIPYNPNGTRTSTTPVFNIYTDVPNYIGNEADFVRLRKSNGDPTVPANQNNFVDPLSDSCAVGSKFDVRTYIHNGADANYNNNGNGSAVAHNVNVAMKAPLGVTSSKFTFTSTLSASNAESLTDTATLNCGSDVQLKLVPQTVKVYSQHTSWTGASDSAVNGNLKIGSRTAGSGDQWGCWEDRVIVVYVVEVVEAPKPTPVVTCDAITVAKLGERRYSYGVRSTATNGAALKSVKYYFDRSNDVNNAKLVATAPFTTEYTYAKAGTYRVTTDLTFSVPGQADKVITDAKCATTINTGVEPCPTNPNLPKDSPDCAPCPIPGKEHLPKNSPKCANLPTVIPQTGMGGIIGGFAGISSAAYGVAAFVQKRKKLF